MTTTEPAAEKITVETTVSAPIEKVWAAYTTPDDIKQWNTPSEGWHTTSSTSDLRVGGAFSSRMEAKDGSFGFDFGGVYDEVRENKYIEYTLGDGRKVTIDFTPDSEGTAIVQTFEPEAENPREMQQGGWQAILDNFKRYAESK